MTLSLYRRSTLLLYTYGYYVYLHYY